MLLHADIQFPTPVSKKNVLLTSDVPSIQLMMHIWIISGLSFYSIRPCILYHAMTTGFQFL